MHWYWIDQITVFESQKRAESVKCISLAEDHLHDHFRFHPVMPAEGEVIHGEELAAIALALYRYRNDLHDIESSVITINKVARAYSPWSSKIYGLRQFPSLRR